MEQVLEAALDLLLEKQAKARGQVKKPRTAVATATTTATPIAIPIPGGTLVATPTPPAPAASPLPPSPTSNPAPTLDLFPTEPPLHRRTGPREHIPAAVRRAVWRRDQGKCVWPLDGGGTCGSTHRLELDHLVPWARWGDGTADDLRVVCHQHNTLAARQAFGEPCMNRYALKRGPRRDSA